MEHYRKLENMYHNHPLNEFYEAKMTISDRSAVITIPIDPKLFHAAGATHGSVYFKALDDAAYFAVNSIVDDVLVLTTSFNIYLTRPIMEGRMRAEGKLSYVNKSQLIGEAVLFDSNDEEIARGSGMYIKSKIKLTPDIGYQ